MKLVTRENGKRTSKWMRQNNLPNGFLGKKHTEEWKKTVGVLIKEKVSGERNGSFGSRWMNDGTQSERVVKQNIEERLSSGWQFGRKSLPR